MLEEDNFYANEVARIAEVNRNQKACPVCFLRQAAEHERCRLCQERPEHWLLSVLPPLRTDSQANILNDEGRLIATGDQAAATVRERAEGMWLRWASTIATADKLKEILRSSTLDQLKVAHAGKVLGWRDAQVNKPG